MGKLHQIGITFRKSTISVDEQKNYETTQREITKWTNDRVPSALKNENQNKKKLSHSSISLFWFQFIVVETATRAGLMYKRHEEGARDGNNFFRFFAFSFFAVWAKKKGTRLFLHSTAGRQGAHLRDVSTHKPRD